jgi:hypothetical protein
MKEWLFPANGKLRLKTGLLNPKVTTLQLQTGMESGYLCLDVDAPNHPNNRDLVKLISREDFIIYSSAYSLDDVFAGKVRFKVVYKYNGKHIPCKKTNKAIECFYQKSKRVAIAGSRGDGYDYIYSGNVNYIHFDINDILETKVPFNLFDRVQFEQDSSVSTVEDKVEVESGDAVNVEEFKNVLGRFVEDLPIISIKGNILTFECLFNDTIHTTKNYAYAFKRNGAYVLRCQGEVCSDEYYQLNKKLKAYTVTMIKFEGFTGFGVDDLGITNFLAPTGWGKTEAIAEEVLMAINDGRKLLIMLQNKEAINRLLDRVNHKSNGLLGSLEELKKIFVYISENKTEKFDEDIRLANVIISHHYYFKNAGDVLTTFPSSNKILDLKGLEVIIDEAHSYIELASRMDLDIGGLYENKSYGKFNVKMLNYAGYTNGEVKANPMLELIPECVESYLGDFGTINLAKQRKLYGKVEYLNIYQEVKERMTLVQKFKDENYTYQVYHNDDVKPMKENSLEDAGTAMDLLLNSAEDLVIAVNVGDDVKRKRIGDINLTIYHSQVLKAVLTKPRKVILTTATMNEYHRNLIKRQVKDIKEVLIEDEIEKIGSIVLLRSKDSNNSRMRRKVLETVNGLNSRSLIFFPTIGKAKAVLNDYENVMLNDNGIYCVGKRKDSNDFITNIQRNVTIAGLESSVAKGYNYLEEVDGLTKGFELIYFDTPPVSPQIVKKYIDTEGLLQDYKNDYNISIFSQAIGRAMRSKKETLTIALNKIDDYTYGMIVDYLKRTTNARIIEDDLTITNVRLSISSYVRTEDFEENKDVFSKNKLFRKIYGE